MDKMRDFTLKMIREGGNKGHPGMPITWLPLMCGPAYRALRDEGVVKEIVVTKPSKIDPSKTFDYYYAVEV